MLWALEQKRARLERLCATEGRTEGGKEDQVKKSDIRDREERFRDLFAKLIENPECQHTKKIPHGTLSRRF